MRLSIVLCATTSLLLAAASPGFAAAQAAPSNLKVVARIAGPDGGWDYATFDPARRRLYVAHGSWVMAVDADSGATTPHFVPGDHLHAALAVPGADLLVTTNSGDKTVRIFKASDGTLIKSLTVADDADGAVYDPSTSLVVVVNGDPGLLTLVDPLRQTVVGEINVGGALEFAAVDGKGRLYVNVESTGQVAVVDLAMRKVVTRYAMSGCTKPSGLAYVEGGRIISACASHVAKILDAATGQEIASLTIGSHPDSVLYDADRHLAYIPTAGDGVLSVIALDGPSANSIVGSVPTQVGARTGAVDPKTGDVYLPTAEYVLPVPPGQRPTTKPGTFHVLVVARP